MFAFHLHTREFELSTLKIGNIFKHHLSIEMLIMFVLNNNRVLSIGTHLFILN